MKYQIRHLKLDSIFQFFRTIDLRLEGGKTEIEAIKLNADREMLIRIIRERDDQLSKIHSTYMRQIVSY